MSEEALRRAAAISGRDFPPAQPPQRLPRATTRTVWGLRPYRTSAGNRLLAFRITSEGGVLVLIGGAVPRWAAAESVLSERAAKRWLVACFSSAEVAQVD